MKWEAFFDTVLAWTVGGLFGIGAHRLGLDAMTAGIAAGFLAGRIDARLEKDRP